MPTMLRGPKDPDLFRVQVNRTRWYRDPLPADAKWSPMTEAVPAVTTVKKAWSKPFKKKTATGLVVPLDAYRAAEYVQQNISELAAMHPEQVFGLVATAPDRDLAKAQDRGTALHSVMEALALGQRLAPELHDDAVRPFVPACEQFVDEWRPVWRMTEFVVINRTLGFAGTADALVELPGNCPTCGNPFGLVVIDWKSRGSKHGAYEEEVCQLGAYSSGDYVVVTNEAGHLERIDPPEIAHGAIVSITADDGYRLYPVEIADARHAFLGLFETWRIGRDGKSVARRAVGNPVPAPSPPAQPSPHAPQREVEAAVCHAGTEQHIESRVTEPGGDAGTDPARHADESGQLVPAEQKPLELLSDTSETDAVAHVRSRVVEIVRAAAGRPLPMPWPKDTPTFKPGSAPITAEHLPALTQWCDDTEREMQLPFLPAPSTRAPEPPADPAPAEPRPNPRADAEEWAAKGRALLSLLHDEALARACARTAGCDDVVMTHPRFLALQAVVTQMSDPAGVLLAHWSADGVELRPVQDMEKALLSQMPTEGIITKATKLDALQRGKRVAKRLGVPSPKTYDELCADLLLSACVAVGHGVNRESG